jgi:hypothetical protein
MTDMNRFKWTSFGPWLDEDGPWVLYADAEAAIAATGADMLAKCIAAVDARIRPTLHPLENAGIGEALAALRDLQEKP